jgi:cysteine desulfurase
VLDAMLPYLRKEFGNPSSDYALGRRAKAAVENARSQVAALIRARAETVIFTSGGTEASNLAIRGSILRRSGRQTIVTSTVEHPATEEPCRRLAQEGHVLRRIPVEPDGRIGVAQAADEVASGAALVTLIHAQNETGVLQPVVEIARQAHRAGAIIHIDAAQSVGKVAIDVEAMDIDLLSIAGHKLYAPKGIGALYVRDGIELAPVLVGAGQEAGRRPGTENVPYIVGLGEACRLAASRLHLAEATIRPLTHDLFARLQNEVPGLVRVGHPTERLPNTLNVLFPGVSGREVLAACPGICASTGSACHADREEASPVLRALGLPEREALGAVRLSLGFDTTEADIASAAALLGEAWRRIVRETRPRATA